MSVPALFRRRRTDVRICSALRLVRVQPDPGTEAPSGTCWACLHPDCVAAYGTYGFWGRNLDGHAETHADPPPPVLAFWPDEYAGCTSRPGELFSVLAAALDGGHPIMVDVRQRTWSADGSPLTDDFHGVAYVRELHEDGTWELQPDDGQTVRVQHVRSARRLLTGEQEVLAADLNAATAVS
jgi:hypothetical protein